ncbi:hypothetical protein V2J09_022309 [Rumex salicifolius]
MEIVSSEISSAIQQCNEALNESEVKVDLEVIELDAVEILAEHVHFCEIYDKGFKRDANMRMHMRAHGEQFKRTEALAKPISDSAADVVDKKSSTRFSHFLCKRQNGYFTSRRRENTQGRIPTIKMGSKPGVRTSKSNGQNKSTRSASAATTNLWLSDNPSQRWGELFFLLYTPFWLTLCLGIVVPFKLYENFKELEYLLLALISAVPSVLIPLLFVGKADKGTALKDRYWVKASVWIVLFSYVGNYFWTHYFFTVLGASYTFPSWRMNDIPHTTFLLTHVCFLFYHVSSNMTLRRLRHSISHLPVTLQWLMEGAWVLALSYFIAWLETIAISNFPYYEFVDRDAMYKVGSLFYAIYFFVSFPMFRRIDESPNDKWDLPRVAVDALGAAMLVTIILDLWRLFLGPIVTLPETKQCLQSGLPWFSGLSKH